MISFYSLSFLTLEVLSLFSPLTTASPLQESSPIFPRASCTNSASDRSCWGDYNLSTNYYDEVPTTGVTREYYFELQNVTLAPDGVDRIVLTVNGTVPGPTIEADWGDTVVVHVSNSLTANGTSLHFHGVRQNYTNQMDGVASITQCPSAPGETYTYTWRATQYGSSFYHSHYSLQAWDGVFGGIVIHGPASGNYDVDLGSLFIQDWDHQTASSLFDQAETSGPPTLDTGLINGTNMWNGSGSYFEQVFDADSSYLFRIVNSAIDTHFKFTIDNHTMTVIAMDFVPIVPFETDILSIGIAERYDVVVNASAVSGNYWLRAIPQVTCSNNDNVDGILGIIRYDSTSTADPTTTGYTYTDDCDDEDLSNLVPYLALDAGSEDLQILLEDSLVTDTSTGVFHWELNGTYMAANWEDPTVLQVLDNVTNFNASLNVYEIPTANEWAYMIIEQTNTVPHPIHLHGHDFYVLAQGTGTYSSTTTTLTTTNPPRRDVAMLPGAGYLVIAWPADNPGVWLCHCHIGWHQSEGFDLQFVERYDEIAGLLDATVLEDTCSAWDTYVADDDLVLEDSGV